MESDEIDVKPTIPTGELLDTSKSSLTGPSKFKQSRYEDVWPEDVHAAFMEAVALYPPMGKRRLKYYRVSTRHCSDAKQMKSFGRCQLIQSYILDKTGKNRSRKQVSSHLQRLKKIYKDNPAMHPLFSERSKPSTEYTAPEAASRSSQDLCANISFSTRHIKSDFDLAINLQNPDVNADNSRFSYTSEASSEFFNGASCNAFELSTDFYNRSPSPLPGPLGELLPSHHQFPAGTSHPSSSDNDYFSEPQDPSIFNDMLNGIRADSTFNTSAFSISMCRSLATKLPIQSLQVDANSTTHFSRATHSPGPGFQPSHWVSRDVWPSSGASSNSPLTAAQSVLHTPGPFHHTQLTPLEKQRLDASFAYDSMWPPTYDMSFGYRPVEGTFGEIRARYPAALYQYNPIFPVSSTWVYSSPSKSERSRGLSYSHSLAVTTPAIMSDSSTPNSERTTDFIGQTSSASSESLASPFVIRPTPMYPISYVHPKTHPNDDPVAAPSFS